MEVIKRDGRREPFDVTHIQRRIQQLSAGLTVDLPQLIAATLAGCHHGVTTSALDNLTAQASAELAMYSADYDKLAVRLAVSSMHKATSHTFSESTMAIHAAGFVNDAFNAYVQKNAAWLNALIDNTADYSYSHLAISVLRANYLFKDDRPQYALLRTAVMFGDGSPDYITRTYRALSQRLYTHGSSTLINAGGRHQQLLNCFLLSVGDSTPQITGAMADAAVISKSSGGIGIGFDRVRGQGQVIASTGGGAAGVVRFAKIFSEIARTWDQGGRRTGSFAGYLHCHHSDVIGFLRLGDPTSPSELYADNLNRGLMLTELFMKRWLAGGQWSLFSPDTAPGLVDLYDGMPVCSQCGYSPCPQLAATGDPACQHVLVRRDIYTERYTEYEARGLATTTMPAAELMRHITTIATRKMVYLINKDAVCRRSNQDNVGAITQSNLCAEIVQYSDPASTACCVLASICLQNFVRSGAKYDWAGLMDTTRLAIRNLDRAIDINNYPTEAARKNSLAYRALGLGVQGLADVFLSMRIDYLSQSAEQLDMLIHEAMYYAALDESCRLAEQYGPYSAWTGSPGQRGMLSHDLLSEETGIDYCGWKLVGRITLLNDTYPIGPTDWLALRARIAQFGLRNAYLRANMPTVNTGDINGSVGPSTEPINMNVFMKTTVKTLKIVKYNPYLMAHCRELGLWTPEFAAEVAATGRVSHPSLGNIYLTSYEMPQRELIRRSGLRQAFIDQTQSFNVFMDKVTPDRIRGMIKLCYESRLKTMLYYLRVVEEEKGAAVAKKEDNSDAVCRRDDPDCASCQLTD